MSNTTEVSPYVGKICLKVGGTPIIGVDNAPITDKTTSQDVTADQDTAIRRSPTIDDADFKFDFWFDKNGDAGQTAILAAKPAHTRLTFIRYLSGTSGPNYTVSGYMSQIAASGDPKTNVKMSCTVDVDSGAVYAAS